MKIKKASLNNRKKCLVFSTSKGTFLFPYSRLRLKPTRTDRIQEILVDKELGREAITYKLKSGKEDTIHLDEVLEYNQDQYYMRQMLLYKLTLQAQKLLKEKSVPKREVIRRLKTSPTQFYRLMDQTFYRKTIDQMIKLLAALDCPVDIVFGKAA